MTQILFLAPTGQGVGLTAVSTGLVRALERQGLKIHYFKPVSIQVQDALTIAMATAEHYLSNGRVNDLLEMILNNFHAQLNDADVIIVQGLITTRAYQFAAQLNVKISKALSADIIFVAAPGNKNPAHLMEEIELTAREYGGFEKPQCIGCIINKIGAPTDENGFTRLDFSQDSTQVDIDASVSAFRKMPLFKQRSFLLIAAIPWNVTLFSPRVVDIIDLLSATVVHHGDIERRRISHITICARTVPNMLQALKPNVLIITAGDRIDIIVATCMAALKGIHIAGLVLTGDYPLDDKIMSFCHQALHDTHLPLLAVKSNSFSTALKLQNLNMKVPLGDAERTEATKQYTADHIDIDCIQHFTARQEERLLSPPAFRYQLIEKAKAAHKRVVLPEGNEPRTIAAAALCMEKSIAQCILLGNEEEIRQVAENHNITLPDNLIIIDPDACREKYIAPMVALRQHKGLTDPMAKEQLHDNVVLGTMMLQCGDVDGLVSGARNTTANTIRPALQLIKTRENVSLVSSVFFMCMPEQVLVFGDCAVNPEPTASELAEIAIQSTDSAIAFGITPRVAMISYSTGQSGSGVEVEKVCEATEKVKVMRPDILIDGPLQYDAALIKDVAKNKAPNSLVAGAATVFIFPDLNTGNTTYKAVQRSANVLCIGPMLQGLAKPVNDLSRGATIDDIVYTIAMTAIQAT